MNMNSSKNPQPTFFINSVDDEPLRYTWHTRFKGGTQKSRLSLENHRACCGKGVRRGIGGGPARGQVDGQVRGSQAPEIDTFLVCMYSTCTIPVLNGVSFATRRHGYLVHLTSCDISITTNNKLI